MRKSYLLLAASLMISVSGSAQQAAPAAKAVVKNSPSFLEKTAERHPATSLEIGAASANAPRKSYASGIYYQRPVGSYQYGGETNDGQKINYLVLPCYTKAVFKNMSNNAATVWKSAGEEVTDGVEGLDYVFLGAATVGTSIFYAPELALGNDSFNPYDGVITSASIQEFTDADMSLGSYPRYSNNNYIFGSNKDQVIFSDITDKFTEYAIVQAFDKPLTTLELAGITIPYFSHSATPIASGAALNVYITGVGQLSNGMPVEDLDNILFQTQITADNIRNNSVVTAEEATQLGAPELTGCSFGQLSLSFEELDEFNVPMAKPVIIDQPYAIVVSGFQNDGVDVGFYLTDQGGNGMEYEMGNPTFSIVASPTFQDNRELHVWTKGESNGSKYLYKTVIWLNASWEGMFINEETATLTVDAEGGETEDAAQIYTVNNIFDDNGNITDDYEFEGIPDWASIEYSNSYREQYDVTLVAFDVDPLPEGVKGRAANIVLKKTSSGATANTAISLIQGEATNDIKSTLVDQKNSGKLTFNLAGQRVNKDYKGIVIENGKKLIRK